MNYLCYRYLYHTSEAPPRFLFGFLAPSPYKIDIMPTSPSVKLTESLSLEYTYIHEDKYPVFVNEDICDFSILGFNSETPLKIKNIATSFFSQQRFEVPIFSSNKYTNWWLEDYSDLPPQDIMILLQELNKYCSPFFPKYSILNTPHSLPLGSFLIMTDSTSLQEKLVSTDTTFKPDSNNQFPFSITFHRSIINNGHTVRVRLISVANDIMINKIASIDTETKSYKLDNLCPKQIIEIFDETGNSIYDEHRTRIVSFSLRTRVSGGGHTLLQDRLSDKTPSLQELKYEDHMRYNSVSSINDIKIQHLKKYNQHQKDLLDLRRESVPEDQKVITPQTFWYEKMSNEAAVTKIVELVRSAKKTYIFDPFFSSKIVKDKDNKDVIDDNPFLILNRLSGDVSIITSQKTSGELPDIVKSYSPLYKGRLILSIQTAPSLHDRYLLLRNDSEYTIYSLTNSLSSTMKESPIGINEIVGEAKQQALIYLTNIIASSKELYPHNIKPIENTNWWEHSYTKELFRDAITDIDNITADIIPILQKNFDSSSLSISIRLLGIGEMLSYIHTDYKEFLDFYNSLIEQYVDEISLEEITQFLIDSQYYTPMPYSIVQMTLPCDLNIESYEMLENFQRFPSHYYDRENNIPDGYTELLKQVYYTVPDKIFEYFLKSKHYALQQILRSVIAESQIENPISMIKSNTAPVQLLSLIQLLKPFNDMDNTTKKAILDSGIPNHLLFIILISNSYGNQQDNKFTTEYLECLDTLVLFDGSLLTEEDDKYLTRYSEQLLDILPQLKNFNSKLAEQIIYLYLQKDSNIWYTITTNHKVLHSLLIIIDKITEQDKGKFLIKLFKEMELDDRYLLVTTPLAQELFSYDIFGNSNRIVKIMLYLFSRSSDNEKVLTSVLDNIINSLSLSLEQKYSPYINLNFLLLHGFFYIITYYPQLNTERPKQLLEQLKNTSPFTMFYDLYQQENVNSLLLQIERLILYIHEFSDNSTYSNDKNFITTHICDTIIMLIQKYNNDEQKTILETLEAIVNNTFKGLFSISFSREEADNDE